MKKTKIFLLLFLLSFAMILSSCMFPGPGRMNKGGPKAPHHNLGHGPGNSNGNSHNHGHDKR